jgi:cell wall-associated NlpC family hydrolase
MKKLTLCIALLAGSFLSGCSPVSTVSEPSYQRGGYSSYALSPQRKNMMKVAHRSLGTRYKWGGETPREGFDCSGLMQYTYKQSGIRIPRTAAKQRDASRRISRSQLRPGDMIFFKTGRRSNHVGIYTGGGQFIHASTGSKRVKKESLDSSYWRRTFVKYGTFL